MRSRRVILFTRNCPRLLRSQMDEGEAEEVEGLPLAEPALSASFRCEAATRPDSSRPGRTLDVILVRRTHHADLRETRRHRGATSAGGRADGRNIKGRDRLGESPGL